MTRNLVLATAALAAVGFLVASIPTEAHYVLSGLKEYANAPPRALTMKDCRAVYGGEVRLVSQEAFAKYLAKHPGEAVATVSRRYYGGTVSVVGPRRGIGTPIRNWAGECAR